ncbi:aspartate dehydrogenase, partial [Arthrobacter sp. LS16]
MEGVILRRRQDLPYEQFSLDEALERCDMIVESAGQQAVREHAVRILEAGADLLVNSVGVMADREFAARLELAGPGRLYFSSGAVGGLDLLA